MSHEPDGSHRVDGLALEDLSELIASHGIRLHEFTPLRASLEEAYTELVADSVTFRGRDVSALHPDTPDPARQMPSMK